MSKAILTDSQVLIAGVSYPITGEDYSVKYNTVDVPDTATDPDSTETLVGRGKHTFSFEAYLQTGTADIECKTLQSISLDFEGKTYHGSGSLDSMDVSAKLDNGITQKYTGFFSGPVVSTPKS